MAEMDKKELNAYTQRAESKGSGTADPNVDDRPLMDVTEPQVGGPAGEDRADWDDVGVDTGSGMDPSSDTPSGGNWGDSSGLSSHAADGSDWATTAPPKTVDDIE